MFWELIATVLAGFVLAGIALSLRLLFKKLPRWIVPAAAGLGMMGFQIYSEYDWFEHHAERLPAGTAVVATYEEPAFYKPWSYFKAPILKFVAVEKGDKQAGESILPVNLYFFERRMSVQHAQALIDCQNKLQSDFSQSPKWGKTPMTDNIAQAVCP